jgi:histidinol-phosphatase (PHP family)
MPLELNLLGLHGHRHYPNPWFWEMAAEENCKVILGCDAHEPEFLCNEDITRDGLKFLEPYGLELLETVPLRPIGG